MANKKDPPNWAKIKDWFKGSGYDSQWSFGGVDSPGARKSILAAAVAGVGMGLKARSDKKKAFLKKKGFKTELNPDGSIKKKLKKNYDRKTMRDEFKAFRKDMDEMKTGGTTWTRNSRKH